MAAVLALPVPAALADPGPCPVLPPAGPLPVEFSDGSVGFRQAVFARPGITVASTGDPGRVRLGVSAEAGWSS